MGPKAKKQSSPARRIAMPAFAGVVAVMLAALVWQMTRPVPVHTWTGRVFQTPYRIRVQDRTVSASVKSFLDADMKGAFSRLEILFSREPGAGLIADFNGAQTTVRAYVGTEIWRLVDFQKRVHAAGGPADVTLAPLEDLWRRVAAGAVAPPSPEGLRAILNGIGMDKISAPAEGYIIKLRPNVNISMDPIAHGYIADRMAIYMIENHINNFHVEIGGVVLSRNMPGFAAAVPMPCLPPDDPAAAALPRIALQSRQMAAVGRHDGMMHIDPRTGRPVSNDVVCVAVVAESGLAAQCLAVTLYALGAKDGIAWLRHNGFFAAEALFVVDKTGGGYDTVRTDLFPVAAP